jgi:phosphoribosylamine--glycine ligase
MKVLVVGKGGREHALITAIHESPTETEIYSFPGSDAIFEIAKQTDATDLLSLIEFMVREKIELCVAGEESYLVTGEGLADCCHKVGVPCWGPVKASAHLEASKEFAKKFMVRHGIPTGGATAASDENEAWKAITSYPVVLKFDGLAAGKGVVICEDKAAAASFLDEVFVQRRFGEGRVLVEEFLTGPEVSIFVSVVDDDYQILTPARDYKRIGDNDEGLNTGGMGAVAYRQLIGAEMLEQIEDVAIKPTVAGLIADDLPYRGFLYFGFMLTSDGPKLLEYNCRFGDPECQAVMPLIGGDFVKYLDDGAKGKLNSETIELNDGWSVCLILASAGYPVSSRSGDPVSGLGDVEGVRVYHAGTKRNEEGVFETNGGRVLAVVALGESREAARDQVYREAAKIDFPGAQHRSDIATLHFE